MYVTLGSVHETARYVIAKKVLFVLRRYIHQAAGATQICAGQLTGAEAAIYAKNNCFHAENAGGTLLVYARKMPLIP